MDKINQNFGLLRLNGMSECWQTLVETRRSEKLTLNEGLELLLQAEKEQRNRNRTQRLIRDAKFRYSVCIEQINVDPTRGISQMTFDSHIQGSYIKNGESMLITGATGCGKSYLASAFGNQACHQGYSVKYFSVPKLLQSLKLSRLDGSIIKFYEKLAKTDLLIFDDFGLTRIEGQDLLDFMAIIEDRHGLKSTIIVSQLPVSAWFETLSEETIADAILDRLVHTSHRYELKGKSLRKKS